MSANRSTNATDAADDLWLVRLRNGKVRAMTLDELDAAFDAGLINALTPILPPTAKGWTPLGIVAGLDEHAHGTTLVGHSETVIMPSSRPRAQLMSAIPVAPGTPARPAVAVVSAKAKAPAVTRRKAPAPARIAAPKVVTGRMFAALALAVLVLSFGISYGARIALGGTTTSEVATDSVDAPALAPAKEGSTVSAPSSPVAIAADENGPKAAPHHVDSEGVPGRDAQIRKEGPSRARRYVVRRATGRTPFLNGGDKYDPLNAKL